MQPTPTFLSSDYWDFRYLHEQTGWDIGHVSTPLKEYFDQLNNKHIRILIPGGGNSYEAKYLVQQGFTDITIVDISPVLTKRLSATLNQQEITIFTKDFFELDGEFDLIVEQTFFCALDPTLRNKYVEKIKNLLSGCGKLVGLLFNIDFVTNPPFGGNIEKYRQLFSSGLRIKIMESCTNSIPARAGNELFFIIEKELERPK